MQHQHEVKRLRSESTLNRAFMNKLWALELYMLLEFIFVIATSSDSVARKNNIANSVRGSRTSLLISLHHLLDQRARRFRCGDRLRRDPRPVQLRCRNHPQLRDFPRPNRHCRSQRDVDFRRVCCDRGGVGFVENDARVCVVSAAGERSNVQSG